MRRNQDSHKNAKKDPVDSRWQRFLNPSVWTSQVEESDTEDTNDTTERQSTQESNSSAPRNIISIVNWVTNNASSVFNFNLNRGTGHTVSLNVSGDRAQDMTTTRSEQLSQPRVGKRDPVDGSSTSNGSQSTIKEEQFGGGSQVFTQSAPAAIQFHRGKF